MVRERREAASRPSPPLTRYEFVVIALAVVIPSSFSKTNKKHFIIECYILSSCVRCSSATKYLKRYIKNSANIVVTFLWHLFERVFSVSNIYQCHAFLGITEQVDDQLAQYLPSFHPLYHPQWGKITRYSETGWTLAHDPYMCLHVFAWS